MIKKIYLVTLLVVCSTAILLAQDRDRRPTESKGVVYNKEYGGNLQLMTNGWSIGGHYGIMNSYSKTRIYSFEIGELKSPREDRRQSLNSRNGGFSNTSRSFIYGKQNNFYTVKFGIGEKRYLSEKADRKGVAVGLSYSFGPSLGLIKPYYLEIQNSNSGGGGSPIRDVKYNGILDSEFLTGNIYGASSALLGFNELSLAVGGQMKAGLHLDWGAYDEFLRALEVGIAVDVYSKSIPIMVTDDNSPFFVNLYVKAELGKRE